MKDTTMLKYVKDYLGYGDDEAFNSDILANINLSLSTMNQLGVGKVIIAKDDTKWSEYIPDDVDIEHAYLPLIVNYTCLKTKVLFDPPAPTTLNYMDRELQSLETRLEVAWDPFVRKGV